VARGDLKGAERELKAVQNAAQNRELAQQRLEFNTSGQLLGIASDVLAGHIAAARGDFSNAIAVLRKAARQEDELTYGEPPEWSVPVRQELGLVLLKTGRPAEAEQAFREDLKRFPDNVWSLQGVARALNGQDKTREAQEVSRRLRRIWSKADMAPGIASL
jgi:Flp pilus assembly protein TadD